MPNDYILRWGIVGLGKIANDFVLAMAHSSHSHKVVAVSTANSRERAEQFCNKMGIYGTAKAHGNYAELMRDPDVDIVYIATLNHNHFLLTILALENGKHVLCEKPMTYSAAEVDAIRKVQKTIQQSGKCLFVMEGFWSRFFPAWKSIRQLVRSGEFGRARIVHADFSAPMPPNRRDLLRGESPLMDIGLYTVMFATFVFEGKKVIGVRAGGELDDKGIDLWSNIVLRFEDGGHAVCYCNAQLWTSCAASVTFDGGHVELPERFWCPTELKKWTEMPHGKPIQVQREQFNLPKAKTEQIGLDFVFHNSSGLAYELDHVWEAIRAGRLESDEMGLDESRKIAAVLEEARRQLGTRIERPAHDEPDLT